MNNRIRRKDRLLTEHDAKEILEIGEYGILSTVSLDGQPYGVPLNYSYNGEEIYFHSAKEGHKLINLKTNSRVSFCVVGKTQVLPDKFATKYESVIVFGKAYEAIGEEKQKGFVELVKKYSPDFFAEGLEFIEKKGKKACVFAIRIEEITGKASRWDKIETL